MQKIPVIHDGKNRSRHGGKGAFQAADKKEYRNDDQHRKKRAHPVSHLLQGYRQKEPQKPVYPCRDSCQQRAIVFGTSSRRRITQRIPGLPFPEDFPRMSLFLYVPGHPQMIIGIYFRQIRQAGFRIHPAFAQKRISPAFHNKPKSKGQQHNQQDQQRCRHSPAFSDGFFLRHSFTPPVPFRCRVSGPAAHWAGTALFPRPEVLKAPLR